jgi:hypothetical protein
VSVSRTVWDLRGLEHAVAAYLVDCLSDLFEDTPYVRRWERKKGRLDVRLSEFPRVIRTLGRPCSLRRMLAGMVREMFGVMCSASDVRAWQTVGDIVSWLCVRLQPVERDVGKRSEEFSGEEDDLVRQVEEALSALPMRWGPFGVIRAGDVGPSTPCWCGSGVPYFRCCGVGFAPRAEYAVERAGAFS